MACTAAPQAYADTDRQALESRGAGRQRRPGGLDVFYNISTYLFKDMGNGTEPSPLLETKVGSGELGAKTGKGFYEWVGESGKAVILSAVIGVLRRTVAFDMVRGAPWPHAARLCGSARRI